MEGRTIDAQFHRAVDIVQGLPKGGPVQTSYEEKLWLYSLYKQSTEGDNKAARPGMLDHLGRSKWDSWNKQKGKRKESAKQEYISALIKILKKYADRPTCAAHIAELDHCLPSSQSHTRHRARSTSSSSSSSSYHSSQASPPPSPPRYSSYPPPDPSLPVPDVAPHLIPPSALTGSHKSLLSMSQPRSPPPLQSQTSEAGYSRSARGTGRGVLPYTIASGSRTHSLVGGPTASADNYAYGGRNNSIHSLRPPQPRSNSATGLGYIPTQPGPGSADYSNTPQVIQRDFTPTLTAAGTPYIGMHHPTPTYPPNPNRRIGTPSTYSAPPINVPATLQQIQTSLLAIHERMNHLERSQAMILRRDEKKRTWFWARKEGDDLDEAENEIERARLARRPEVAGGREVRTAIGTKVRKRWSLRFVWWLFGLSRRLMVDAGVGLLVGLAAMMIVRGWRGDMGRLVKQRLRGLLEAA